MLFLYIFLVVDKVVKIEFNLIKNVEGYFYLLNKISVIKILGFLIFINSFIIDGVIILRVVYV